VDTPGFDKGIEYFERLWDCFGGLFEDLKFQVNYLGYYRESNRGDFGMNCGVSFVNCGMNVVNC